MTLSTSLSLEVREYLSMLCTSSTVWVVFTMCSVLTKFLPFFHKIASHGKCNKYEAEGLSTSSVSRLQELADRLHEKLFISKKWFVHLYLIGAGCALFHLYDSIEREPHTESHMYSPSGSESESSEPEEPTTMVTSFFLSCLQPPCLLQQLRIVLLLWLFHNLRRLGESLFLTHYGDSRMHVAGFIAGLVHYITVPICFREASESASSASASASVSHATDNNCSTIHVITSLRCALPCWLFVLANFYQFEAHKILFQMKAEQQAAPDPKVYQLPTRSWFKVVCVPHYTAEILVYLSLALLLPLPLPWSSSGSGNSGIGSSWSPLLLVLWVTSNLSVVAHHQYQWYQHQYPAEVPRPWYKLIPYVW